MAQVVFKDVWKIFAGDVVAVRDASFTIDDGEFMVIVGPSGCGKSTTLRMVAGLEDVTKGTISIDGRVVNDMPPRARRETSMPVLPSTTRSWARFCRVPA